MLSKASHRSEPPTTSDARGQIAATASLGLKPKGFKLRTLVAESANRLSMSPSTNNLDRERAALPTRLPARRAAYGHRSPESWHAELRSLPECIDDWKALPPLRPCNRSPGRLERPAAQPSRRPQPPALDLPSPTADPRVEVAWPECARPCPNPPATPPWPPCNIRWAKPSRLLCALASPVAQARPSRTTYAPAPFFLAGLAPSADNPALVSLPPLDALARAPANTEWPPARPHRPAPPRGLALSVLRPPPNRTSACQIMKPAGAGQAVSGPGLTAAWACRTTFEADACPSDHLGRAGSPGAWRCDPSHPADGEASCPARLGEGHRSKSPLALRVCSPDERSPGSDRAPLRRCREPLPAASWTRRLRPPLIQPKPHQGARSQAPPYGAGPRRRPRPAPRLQGRSRSRCSRDLGRHPCPPAAQARRPPRARIEGNAPGERLPAIPKGQRAVHCRGVCKTIGRQERPGCERQGRQLASLRSRPTRVPVVAAGRRDAPWRAPRAGPTGRGCGSASRTTESRRPPRQLGGILPPECAGVCPCMPEAARQGQVVRSSGLASAGVGARKTNP